MRVAWVAVLLLSIYAQSMLLIAQEKITLVVPPANSPITLIDAFEHRVDVPVPLPPEVIAVGRAKQLFADDWGIASAERLKRTLHPVEKYDGNPVLTADNAWENPAILLAGSVIYDPDRDEDRFRMWYLCYTPKYNDDYSERISKTGCVSYAISSDGITWTRPMLGLHEFEGSRENNIVIPEVHGFHGVNDDPRDPEHRYKAHARTKRGHDAYFSKDGIHFDEPRHLGIDGYDRSSVHWDPRSELWIASTKSWYRESPGAEPWRGRGYQESQDFLDWPEKSRFMAGTTPGSDELVYGLEIFFYETQFFGAWSRYRYTPDGIVDMQLAVSRNARHWERPSDEAWVPTSPLPSDFERKIKSHTPITGVDPFDPAVPWDYGYNNVNTLGPLRVGDELWVYYSGRTSDHHSTPQTGAIGLAKMRLDGFFSMDAGNEEAELLTRPVSLVNPSLRVNADAEAGELRVEITDVDGEAIPPFTLENCTPLTTDNVRHEIRWNGADDVSAVVGRPVQLRFIMQNAELYAYWTGEEREWHTPNTLSWQDD